MIKDLVKLADYLDQTQQQELANQVDLLISKVAASPFRFTNQPERAPYPYEAQRPGDISGEWNIMEDLDSEDLPTEELAPTHMLQQHKASKEVIDAIQKTLNKWDQHLLHIRWHHPGITDEHMVGEQESDPYWAVIAAPNDPAELPSKNHWAFWEVSPEDEMFGISEPIEGKETRIYGEW